MLHKIWYNLHRTRAKNCIFSNFRSRIEFLYVVGKIEASSHKRMKHTFKTYPCMITWMDTTAMKFISFFLCGLVIGLAISSPRFVELSLFCWWLFGWSYASFNKWSRNNIPLPSCQCITKDFIIVHRYARYYACIFI